MIVMVGIPGSGKTTFAEKFADTFRAPYICRDTIASLLDDDSKKVDNLLSYQLGELLKTQQSVIVDTNTASRTVRSELARRARSAGYQCMIIWVQVDSATAKNRSIKESRQRGGHVVTPEEYDHHLERFAAPSALEKPTVISGKHTYAAQAKVVLKKISEPRAEIASHTVTPPRRAAPRRNITIR
jgi:predicted kinase